MSFIGSVPLGIEATQELQFFVVQVTVHVESQGKIPTHTLCSLNLHVYLRTSIMHIEHHLHLLHIGLDFGMS